MPLAAPTRYLAPAAVVDRLRYLRALGESFSEGILRLAADGEAHML